MPFSTKRKYIAEGKVLALKNKQTKKKKTFAILATVLSRKRKFSVLVRNIIACE